MEKSDNQVRTINSNESENYKSDGLYQRLEDVTKEGNFYGFKKLKLEYIVGLKNRSLTEEAYNNFYIKYFDIILENLLRSRFDDVIGLLNQEVTISSGDSFVKKTILKLPSFNSLERLYNNLDENNDLFDVYVGRLRDDYYYACKTNIELLLGRLIRVIEDTNMIDPNFVFEKLDAELVRSGELIPENLFRDSWESRQEIHCYF